ncbi:hypothetical protein SAMN05444920_116282 [Nonomuraea solani]|uniref:Uncharacterized protein n=1 Tax=Nonomuraea solani TaxID=1144553 RepID=A0A1H6EU26_9ACTN|nr:hypothetical protein [Nonomuraea solani]SEH00546.1 hypothetical protein SAMN05444920_116282 [Nonomuraea solani]
MPALEDEIRRLMADETASLHAAPDLVERVVRSSRTRRKRARFAALAASVAVVATPIAFVAAGTVATTGQEPPTVTMTPEPPAIDDVPPARSDSRDLGDLGDGRAFGQVRVGYLPKGLRWSRWSLDLGDRYTTSYNAPGDEEGHYRVQIYMYEDQAVQEVSDRLLGLRDEGEGEEVAIGDRTGFLAVQNVGEDGMKGTPTLFLKMSDTRWAEIMFSPVYAKEFSGAAAVTAELKKIAEGLTPAG